MKFEQKNQFEQANQEEINTQQLAAQIGKEAGLDKNGLGWFLRDIKFGEIAEIDELIERYGLEPILNKPEVIALARQGLETAKKEERPDAVEHLKKLFKL